MPGTYRPALFLGGAGLILIAIGEAIRLLDRHKCEFANLTHT